MAKLTKRFIEAIAPDPVKTLKFWDDEIRRFGLIVLPSGRKTYCIEYRNADRVQKRLKIGIYGQLTPEEARSLARIRLAQVAQGEDIVEKSRAIRKTPTFAELANDYLERHALRKRDKSLKEDQRLLKNIILPAFGSAKVEAIERRNIETLHLQLSKYPYQANRVLALLSKMFTLAIAWGWRENNPVKGIQKNQEEKRDRWLNHEELQRFWAVLDKYPHHLTAYVFKFLVLTGARKGEAIKATWDQFDLEKGLWIKPSHMTKQKKTEYLPLSGKTLSVLQDIKKLSKNSLFLFPGRIEGQPIKEIKTFWRRVIRSYPRTYI